MPRINAHAREVISIVPKFITIPPTPVIKITEAVKMLQFRLKSTFWSIFIPEREKYPYKGMQIPPITHAGIVSRKAIKGLKKEKSMQRIAQPHIEIVDAFRVIAIQPIDSL